MAETGHSCTRTGTAQKEKAQHEATGVHLTRPHFMITQTAPARGDGDGYTKDSEISLSIPSYDTHAIQAGPGQHARAAKVPGKIGSAVSLCQSELGTK